MEKISWYRPHSEVEPKAIEEIEQHFGIKFPRDYVECARVNNGGQPEPDAFDYESYNGTETTGFGALLSFHPEKPDYIVNVYHHISDRLSIHSQRVAQATCYALIIGTVQSQPL